ncbi:AraC family transcriptional regulator [Martelella sp. HB161492]|uniref:AraC family transcriptional regulator n=1 Tax=Martelella sp. HB161492 TaxID=2720726 RepID=UPI0015911715|nr:AraC family transcriptional regulator [Martelella sp. HB161492]
MNLLPNPMMERVVSASLLELAGHLAPQPGYNATGLPCLRLLRSEAVLEDVPVLYRPGAVFVLQGSKQGLLEKTVYRYDPQHYLAVSVPVPFRMTSNASPQVPLLAIYLDFDLRLAAEIAAELDVHRSARPIQAKSLVSSPMEPAIAEVLLRILRALCSPEELSILGDGLVRELHYRILVGPQGRALSAALLQNGAAGKIIKSLARIRDDYSKPVSVSGLAVEAGMSVPSYHAHFKALTGSTPIQYIKATRLHEARLMIARGHAPISAIAAAVGYVSAAQFSRDFKRHFRRSATEEVKWMHEHLGEIF